MLLKKMMINGLGKQEYLLSKVVVVFFAILMDKKDLLTC